MHDYNASYNVYSSCMILENCISFIPVWNRWFEIYHFAPKLKISRSLFPLFLDLRTGYAADITILRDPSELGIREDTPILKILNTSYFTSFSYACIEEIYKNTPPSKSEATNSYPPFYMSSSSGKHSISFSYNFSILLRCSVVYCVFRAATCI